MSVLRVSKGHGTENDFVLISDLDGGVELSAPLVRALCDRHSGIGADGVLRVVRSANDPAAEHLAGEAPFFMDYRNADGSIAEMCGNGVRVFLRYLLAHGLAETSTAIATRAGVRKAWLADDGAITVEMGTAQVLPVRPMVITHGTETAQAGTALEIPNPHVVVELRTEAQLAALDLSRPPLVEPALPHGQNVEFVVRLGPRHVSMRVHERGVGETRSCGTGICAVVVAMAGATDRTAGSSATWQVDVPGGTCWVTLQDSGDVLLTGPAVLVGDIELSEDWLAAATA